MPLAVSSKQIAAFRLTRHHLLNQTYGDAASVAGDIAGAQAQVLSAAQLSIWARTRNEKLQTLDDALWKKRKLVRAWCMRRTMFLLPSDELALFIRGTSKRPEYNLEWAQARVSSKQQLDKLLESIIEILRQPSTRTNIANSLKSQGYRLKSKAGGGWGSTRSVPWVEVGGTFLPVGFLLHTVAAVHAICSGPNSGAESTYVRADSWLPRWKDMPREQAEERLLVRYLRAFGPATITDYAIWVGLYIRDAKEIWSRIEENIALVEVDGHNAGILESDLPDQGSAKIDESTVRLLPNFDTFLLGHKSHRNVVEENFHKKIYRSQGWVTPVVLVVGRALGVWSYVVRKNELEVRVTPFSKFSSGVKSQIRQEATRLGEFLGEDSVKTVFQ